MPTRQVDTNIVSFRVRKDPLARKYRKHLAGYALAVSFQTLAELYEWADSSGWSAARRAVLDAYLQSVTVYHSDDDLCRRWAEVRAARRTQPIATDDAWIAATALANGVELVTHNPADFAAIPGLTVITEAP
ncbi:MAG: PIN domain-containing protein [Gemmataceae bacterium]|nr:PIN domain-containing protein [Gemmataceae bacterium]